MYLEVLRFSRKEGHTEFRNVWKGKKKLRKIPYFPFADGFVICMVRVIGTSSGAVSPHALRTVQGCGAVSSHEIVSANEQWEFCWRRLGGGREETVCSPI